MRPTCVITTINAPTRAVEVLSEKFPGDLIVVGDVKTPRDWSYPGTTYISVDRDDAVSYAVAPVNHYARKNLGYLYAMQRGASMIYDTDDDNVPNRAWRPRDDRVTAHRVDMTGWVNVYRYFHRSRIWPRGLSLAHLWNTPPRPAPAATHWSPIQQGLADGHPDVDAIWRPFNSQTTWWWPAAYPLMYLPIHATFRMTDIWRSFIAQRCLWALGAGVTFHSPSEVTQDRNPHDLIKDFESEIPGYLHNHGIAHILSTLPLDAGRNPASVADNLFTCYHALVAADLLPAAELTSVGAWVSDIKRINS